MLHTHASLEKGCWHLLQPVCMSVCVFPINLAGVLLARLACVLEIGEKQRSSDNGQHMDG